MYANSLSQRRYLINTDWFNQWMSFLYGQLDACPGRIDNSELSNRIIKEGIHTMRKNIDFFEFPYQTWQSLCKVYKGSPAILINFNGKIVIEPNFIKDTIDNSDGLKHTKVLNKNKNEVDEI